MKLVVAYVPVLHQGYVNFLTKHSGDWLGLIGPDFYSVDPKFLHLTREIRALPAEVVRTVLEPLRLFRDIRVLTKQVLREDVRKCHEFVLPDEDLSRHVAHEYLAGCSYEFDGSFRLRFDMPASLSKVPVNPDRAISLEELDREMMGLAFGAAERSPDWWRQVGAVCVKDGQTVFVEFNSHVPSEHYLYAMGDPRGNFKPGEHVDVTCAHHAERTIIAKAAGFGPPLAGASIYISTFPCPSCAYSILAAGIGKIYYRDGYSSLEAADICKDKGVEIIHVPN